MPIRLYKKREEALRHCAELPAEPQGAREEGNTPQEEKQNCSQPALPSKETHYSSVAPGTDISTHRWEDVLHCSQCRKLNLMGFSYSKAVFNS